MPDPLPQNAIPSDAHVPWESIDAGEESGQLQEIGQAKNATAEAVAPAKPGFAGATASAVALSAPQPEPDEPPSPGGGWTLPLLCAGIALIACCVLIPQADANRRLVYERQMLVMDLESIEHQVAVNGEFLKKVGDDPTLAERLAERQMKVIPEGTRVLELKHESDGTGMSPFQLVSVAPPPPLPAYRRVGGTIADLCYDPHTRLYLIGAALVMIAMGLVLGHKSIAD
jgi:hypothetical protein